MTDPMTGYDQAEAEAVERTDEARREQHWREAEQAAREWFQWWKTSEPQSRKHLGLRLMDARALLQEIDCTPTLDSEHLLNSFRDDYGGADLLRVIANALEQK